MTTWHLDEVYLKIDGRMVYLWRAVDADGEVLDALVQSEAQQALRVELMRRLLRKYAVVPERILGEDLADPENLFAVSFDCFPDEHFGFVSVHFGRVDQAHAQVHPRRSAAIPPTAGAGRRPDARRPDPAPE